jgi:hypothetical protein
MKRIWKEFGLITVLIGLALVVKAEGPDKGITPQSASTIEKDNQKKESPSSANSPEKPPKASVKDLENSIDDLQKMVEEIEKRGLSPKDTNKALNDLAKRLWKETNGLDALWVSFYMRQKGFPPVWNSAEFSICCTGEFWDLLDKEVQQLEKDSNYRDGLKLLEKVEAVRSIVPPDVKLIPLAKPLFPGCICPGQKRPDWRSDQLEAWKLEFIQQDPEYQAKHKPLKTWETENWKYEHIPEGIGPMARGSTEKASTLSINTISFKFAPYAGAQHGTLLLIAEPRKDISVILSIEKGAFLIESDGHCEVLVRFDDGKPQSWSAGESNNNVVIISKIIEIDQRNAVIFINHPDIFVTSLKQAKKVRIEAPFYTFQKENRVLEFNVEGLQWETASNLIPGHYTIQESHPPGTKGGPMVYVSDFKFYIDKYEVTNQDYQQCISSGACAARNGQIEQSEHLPLDEKRFNKVPKRPVAYVKQEEARTYCQWAGKRLPKDQEWQEAAQGTDGRIYPWGNQEPNCSLANYSNCASYIPASGGSWSADVGSRPAGASPYGALDMAGNVKEWVEEDGWLRGCSFQDDDLLCLRVTYRGHGTATYRLSTIGFRCARDGS